MTRIPLAFFMLVWTVAVASSAVAETEMPEEGPSCSAGKEEGVIIAPVYSHIYHGDRLRPFLLAVTVAARNPHPVESLELVRVEYRGSGGELVRVMEKGPVVLRPFASASFKVKESDTEGGSGASMVITWRGPAGAAPIVESVMIGTSSAQGISFTSKGEVVSRRCLAERAGS